MTTLEDLKALAPEWEVLWQNDKRATPFQSPAWLLPWTEFLWQGGELLIQEERTAGKLTGLLLLFRWGREEQTTVSFLGAGVSDYGDQLGSFRQLVLPGDAVLEELRPESPLRGTEPCSVCPILALSDYPTKLDPKLRTDLHRAQNRLSKLPHRFIQSPDPATFLDLHAKRWNATPDPTLSEFQRQAAHNFSHLNLLRLYELHIEDRPAAALFAIAAHGTLYCYLTAYDPAFQKFSPGALLLRHTIESAQAEGLHTVDFLRGAEPYKYLWGATDRVNFRLRLGTNIAESREQPEW